MLENPHPPLEKRKLEVLLIKPTFEKGGWEDLSFSFAPDSAPNFRAGQAWDNGDLKIAVA
jgi:hypothetical protein